MGGEGGGGHWGGSLGERMMGGCEGLGWLFCC